MTNLVLSLAISLILLACVAITFYHKGKEAGRRLGRSEMEQDIVGRVTKALEKGDGK